MSEQSFLAGIIIFGIVIIVLAYKIKKLEEKIETLEYNNDSFMEILLMIKNGAKIEKVEIGDDDNA